MDGVRGQVNTRCHSRNPFSKALNNRNNSIAKVDDFEELIAAIETKGGFVSAH